MMVYYGTKPGEWSILGSVSTNKPSAIFETGWTTKPDLAAAESIQLYITLESLDFEANVDLEVKNRDLFEKNNFALKIGNDLYKYMQVGTMNTQYNAIAQHQTHSTSHI